MVALCAVCGATKLSTDFVTRRVLRHMASSSSSAHDDDDEEEEEDDEDNEDDEDDEEAAEEVCCDTRRPCLACLRATWDPKQKRVRCPLCQHVFDAPTSVWLMQQAEEARLGGLKPLRVARQAAAVTSSAAAVVQLELVQLDGRITPVSHALHTPIRTFLDSVATAVGVPLAQLALQFAGGKARVDLQMVYDAPATTLAHLYRPQDNRVHVFQVLYKMGNLENVRFDLRWGFPPTGTDYLDGSCLIFFKSIANPIIVDYNHTSAIGGAIWHSGDVMHATGGAHTINMSVINMPKDVDLAIFALSAYTTPTIGNFSSASVSMYDLREPTKELCSYQIQRRAGSKQAVLMCAWVRTGPTSSQVDVIDVPSAGTVRDYSSMSATAKAIVARYRANK